LLICQFRSRLMAALPVVNPLLVRQSAPATIWTMMFRVVPVSCPQILLLISPSRVLTTYFFKNIPADIIFQFVLSGRSSISLTTCHSPYDSYLSLLDANGNYLVSSDDDGSTIAGCSSYSSLITGTFAAVSSRFVHFAVALKS
jgi:hypothetical protein